MPNHIQNRLQFIGDESEVKKVMSAIQGQFEDEDKMTIDFNKIKPCPKEMNIDSTGWLMPLENQFSKTDKFKEHLDKLRDHIKINPDRKEETVKNFLQGVSNYIEHGYATWYRWNIDNWGTKWNAYSQNDKRDTENTIYFQTAWSAPIKLICDLSDQFPNVKLELTYSDENSGCNVGKYSFCKGEVTDKNVPENMSKEAYELYFELHPGREQDYTIVDGKYQFKED
jgi:Ferredoxin-like domain in Api92-like protein